MIANTILTVVLCVIAAAVVLGAFVIIAHWYAVRHPEVRNPEMPEEYWER